MHIMVYQYASIQYKYQQYQIHYTKQYNPQQQMDTVLIKDQKQKIQSKLFQAIFELPPPYKQEVKQQQTHQEDHHKLQDHKDTENRDPTLPDTDKDKQKQKQKQKEKEKDRMLKIKKQKQKQLKKYKSYQQYCVQLQNKVQAVITALINQAKTNSEQIEKVCKTNAKLIPAARLLRQLTPPEGVKQSHFSILISSIINMFTLMMTSSKMVQFFNKLNIPFSIYRILLRMYCICGKFQFFKKVQVYESFKFIWKLLNIKSKTFSRMISSLIMNIFNQYTDKMNEKQKRQAGQDLIINKQTQRSQQCIRTVVNIALDLIKWNLKLSAESGVLIATYRKAIQNDISSTAVTQLIQTIAHHMNTRQNRQIILNHLDLCRPFALFTYVDYRPKEGKTDQKIQRCANIIQMLLSYCSTLFYFISEKVTLRNFVLSLKSKSKNQKQLSIINEKIFRKIIDKTLKYDRNKMQRSNNVFGLYSNNLNYRSLLIMSFFLDSTQLFQNYLNSDPNGILFAGLGKLSLMYFPITFQKGKYNKQIIQTIKLPSASDYQRLSRELINILSYYDYCIIPYQFAKNQLISYLLEIKALDCYSQTFSNQNKNSIQILLERAKKSHCQDFDELLLNFYSQIMKICEILPWKPQHLKLAKFLSVIVDYLRNRNYNAIMSACLQVLQRIFNSPKTNYFSFLYITALDDIGKYFQDHDKVQILIFDHYRDYNYAFRISRILLHTDFNKRQTSDFKDRRKIIQTICCGGGCQQLILQAIEIIRFYSLQSDDRADWGVQLICEKLIYHHSEDIAGASVQFCQQFVVNHKKNKSYLYKVQLAKIKDSNLKKRIMYLLLNCDRGISILKQHCPSFIKDQIDLWLKQGQNLIKELSIFLTKESKRFVANKQGPFLDIGKVSQNRHKLIFLPWNVTINQKRYIALATYKLLKQKIKLRVTPYLLVQTKIQVIYVDIGDYSITAAGDTKSVICVKREQIIKNYERNRLKQSKQIKKFAISKQKITFFFKYQAGCLVLERLLIDIPLARDVYRSISYPLSLLTMLAKTKQGFNYMREHKFIEACLKACKYKDEKDEKDIDIELSKGSIQCLGLLFASWKLQLLQKIQIFTTINQIFEKTTNFQIKQVALWVLNIIVKDDDLRRKLKQSKGWLILQSKYCGWLCYPQFYNQTDFNSRQICQFLHINNLLPQRPLHMQGFKLIYTVLQLPDKTDKDILTQKTKKKQMIQFFRKAQNKQQAWDPKLLQKIVSYVSIVNFGIERTRQVLEMFNDYYCSQKFDMDIPTGSVLQ